jgi:hypothetical protein
MFGISFQRSLFTALFATLSLVGCGGGGGGGGAFDPAQQATIATASSAGLTATQSQAANASISSAVTNLASLISSDSALSSNSSVTASARDAQAAVDLAVAAQVNAAAAAADLAIASNVSIVAVISAGRSICAAASSCTAAEISTLSYKAAETAKNAAEASLYAITAANRLKSVIISVAPSANVSTATAAITTAQTSAASAQATANQVISNHTTVAINIGVTLPAISLSTGNTGSVAGTPTYSGNTQTIVTTSGNGETSTATNTALRSAVTWAADNVTRTTTYTFANGGTNAVVDTVPGTVSSPSVTAAVYPSDWTTGTAVTPPSVSARQTTFGNGVVVDLENGTSSLPFHQSTLSTASITDPNSFVTSSTTFYDLRWGTPDPDGPLYSAAFADGAANFVTFPEPILLWGNQLSGQCLAGPIFGFCLNGPTLATPHPEVLEAWQKGWTGKGVSVMIEDALFGVNARHGATVSLLAGRYAIGSDYFGLDISTGINIYESDGSVADPQNLINFGVANLSYGASLIGLIGRSDSSTWTQLELDTAALQYASRAVGHVERLTGVSGWTNFNYTDAVIVKAAGNDSISADKEPLNKALATNELIRPRLLIVGALDRAGFVSVPASFASYSNTAGTDVSVASRFLVASGTTPFGDGYLALNGVPIAGTDFGPDGRTLSGGGTSYAAPRVTGYVAILRQKFPNLNGEKSSSILLDTARYDTLTCHPNCDPSIYGKGEASLTRALAPIGRLR